MNHSLLQFEIVSGNSVELAELIKLLDNDLSERYGDAVIHGIDLKKADNSGVIFVLGWFGKEAVCCGALRPFFPLKVELKRMFVKKEHRGKGFSKLLYNYLETEAKKQQFNEIILETGLKQFEAQALYEKMGFIPIDLFGEYMNDPNSICYGKTI